MKHLNISRPRSGCPADKTRTGPVRRRTAWRAVRLLTLALASVMALSSWAYAAAPLPPPRDDPIDYGGDNSGTDTPGTDTPGTDTPGTDNPGTDTPGTDEPGTDTPSTGVVVLSDMVATIGVGSSITLTTVTDPEDAEVSWTTDSPDVVELAGRTGKLMTVRGRMPGIAYVNARIGDGPIATCAVTVSGVVLSQTTLSLPVNQTQTLIAQAFGDAGSVTAWDWTSSNNSVAIVTPKEGNSAVVRALLEGTSLISVSGGGYSDRCLLTVTRDTVGDITGTLDASGMMKFTTLIPQMQTICREVTGEELQYITGLSVPTAPGTLYDGYVSSGDTGLGVAKSQKYYLSGSTYMVQNISFVPRATTTGTVEIEYAGYTTEGSNFLGLIKVNVAQRSATLAYASHNGSAVQFRSDDFSQYGMSVTNRALQYVTFTLPESKTGTLFYKYTDSQVYDGEVSSTIHYYMTTRPSVNNVYFVPAEGWTGELSLSFTGVDTENRSFTGKVRINVTSTAEEAGADAVEVYNGETLRLRNSYFEIDGSVPYYIRFTSLPAASRGTLYYNDTERVTTGERYYRTGSGRRMTDLSFVAGSGTGTVSIPFTGYDSDGESEGTGHLVFALDGATGTAASGSTLSYSTSGPAVRFSASDFTNRARRELSDIASIQLYAPSPEAGRLVQNYLSPGQYTLFDSTQAYEPEIINQVSFLPKAGYSGTTTMTWAAKDRLGKVYTSTLSLTVTPPVTSRYFYDLSGRDWAIPAVDFFRSYQVLMGTTPTTYDPDGSARRGQFVAVLGRMYDFPRYPDDTVSFLDITNPEMYYTPYVTAAKILGIVDNSEYYYPDAPITRQDAALYLYRCLKRAGLAPEPDVTVLNQFEDLNMLRASAREAMASMVQLGVFQGDERKHLNPTGALTRLQMAAVLYRAVTA